jgi:hypothetical protein
MIIIFVVNFHLDEFIHHLYSVNNLTATKLFRITICSSTFTLIVLGKVDVPGGQELCVRLVLWAYQLAYPSLVSIAEHVSVLNSLFDKRLLTNKMFSLFEWCTLHRHYDCRFIISIYFDRFIVFNAYILQQYLIP